MRHTRTPRLGLVFTGILALLLPGTAFAADGYEVLHWGNIDDLGQTTDVSSADWVSDGRVPVNDEWAYVYDPEFYFFLTGSLGAPDRTAEFADKGYVVVAGAGDPGGYYDFTPGWFDFTQFSASYDPAVPSLDFAVTYNASYVPTLRGFQSYIVYYNYNQIAEPSELVIYDSDRFFWPSTTSGLSFGAQNFLLTGDGQQAHTTFSTSSADSFAGPSAMEIHTSEDSGTGTHWKLMLFAHGNAAAFDGIDLTGYDRLVFHAKASRDVTLQGGFGTGDDSGQRNLGDLSLTTTYQEFELDLSGLDLSDVNTFLWVYLHKAKNPFDFSGVSVFLDNVKLVKGDQFVTQDGSYTLGEHTDEHGSLVNVELLLDSATSYLTPFPGSGAPPSEWVVDRAQGHTQEGPLLLNTVVLRGFYVQECDTKEWVNINETVFAPDAEPLALVGDRYYINHFFAKTQTNVLLDERFACETAFPSYVDVLYEGEARTVLSAGKVQFAYVVEHRSGS